MTKSVILCKNIRAKNTQKRIKITLFCNVNRHESTKNEVNYDKKRNG